MSNIKISNLPPETNLSSINGLAGYNNSGTVKISGADLISALTLNTVLTTSNQASTEIQTISDITRFTSNTFSGENIKLSSNGLTRSAGKLYVETADTGIQFKVDSSVTTDTVEFNLGGISRFNINYRGALGVGANAADYGSAGQVLTSSLLSPFSSTGGAPDPVAISDFQIQVSGKNLFLNQQQYDYEQFAEQLVSSNQLNGSLTTSMGSGLISKSDFQSLYRYYYGNVSRSLPSEDGVAKAIQISGSVLPNTTVDLMVFVEFEREIVVDVRTGARVS